MRRILAIFPAIAVAFFLAASAPAQVASELAQKLRDYARLDGEVTQCFKDGKYEDAAAKCDEMIKITAVASGPWYNKACALARLGKTDAAFEALSQSIGKGFIDVEHMKEDPDLESLRGDKRFAEALAKAEVICRKVNGGGEMAGVKTVEGSPKDGLAYRLRMSPNATKGKPNRVIIWLHPSGGSMNPAVESLAPKFIEKGFALLVPTRKAWGGWSDADVDQLTQGTLPEIEKVEGIDVRKPILFGFSAGGQVALLLWQQDPSRWGGIVLDASYPVTMTEEGYKAGMKLPEGDAARQVPIFVLVGDKDPSAALWKRLCPEWVKAGIPVRVGFVRNGTHQWLFGEPQLKALYAWLADVVAGKIPDVDPNPGQIPADPNRKPVPPEREI